MANSTMIVEIENNTLSYIMIALGVSVGINTYFIVRNLIPDRWFGSGSGHKKKLLPKL